MMQPSVIQSDKETLITACALPSTRMLDVPAAATAFSRRLRDAGIPVTTADAEQYALSLALVKPSSRHALYWTTRAVFVTSQQQQTTFDRVFGDVFGSALA